MTWLVPSEWKAAVSEMPGTHRIHAVLEARSPRTRCGKRTHRMTVMADPFTGMDQTFAWAINNRPEGVACGLCLRALGAEVSAGSLGAAV